MRVPSNCCGEPTIPENERRVALVIGNDDYANPAWKLQNAVNDANDLAAELEAMGFEVRKQLNADRPSLERAVDEFVAAVRPGDVALFHYSGHGIQIGGENYLIPTDFNATDQIRAKHSSYSANLLQELMENTGSRLNIIVLDACRNNPFGRSRGGTRGLAAMQAGRGTYIAFATARGQTADDNRAGRNGLFTTYLLETLREPGLTLDGVFNRVRQRVLDASKGEQIPWSNSSVIGEFYFRLEIRQEQPQPPAGDTALQVELAYWNSIKDSTNPAAFESYLSQYPQGQFAPLARLKITEMAQPAAASSAPSRPAAAPPKQQQSTPSEVARLRPPSTPPPSNIEDAPGVGKVVVNPKDGLKYDWVPPGEFEMGCSLGDSDCNGDENPGHRVRISRGFWIGQTEVTVGAYERFANATGREMPPAPDFNPNWREKEHPVVRVTWDDAAAYCQWAGMRLPTEAQWEYAARAGAGGKHYGELDLIAWYAGNSGNRPLDSTRLWQENQSEYGKTLNANSNRTHPVAQKQPNAWKLYDMLGNVWEWCADWYGENYYQGSPAADPPGPSVGNTRVLRGASWALSPGYVRLSYRFKGNPAVRNNGLGFRCARDGN